MNISTFARRAGISPSGVRWYESAGVLPSPVRRENGYREYSDADLSRLTLILALRRLGLTPAEAYYVKCDDETNPAEGIDAGQVVCEIGIAPVKPAEFVVFRFSQKALES